MRMASALRLKRIFGLFIATCFFLLIVVFKDQHYIHQEVRYLELTQQPLHNSLSENTSLRGNVDRRKDDDEGNNGNQKRDSKQRNIAGTRLNEVLLQEIRAKMVPQTAPNLVLDPEQTAYRHNSQAAQSIFIDEALGGLHNGFFVECGAADGKALSNSLFFERARNWTGLLVEANPNLYERIQKNNRSAYSINACMSLTREPSTVVFRNANLLGGIVDGFGAKHTKRINSSLSIHPSDIAMKCYSLYNMLQAIGQMHVNYFSLDVEGPEVDILKTIPFDKVVIDFLTVEYHMTDNEDSVKKLHEIRDFMVGTGLYEQIAILTIGHPKISVGDSMKKRESRGLDVAFKRRGFSRDN